MFFDDSYILGEDVSGFERRNIACPSKYIVKGLEQLRRTVKGIELKG